MVSESLMCSFSSSSRFWRGLLVFLGDDFEVGLDRVHADDVILLVQIHAIHAAGVAAHRTHFGFAEEDGLAFVAGQENHLLAVGEFRADEFVLVLEVDGDDAGGTRIGKFGQRGLFHGAEFGGQEHEAAFFFQIRGGHERGELFVFLEFHQVGDGSYRASRQRLRAIHKLSANTRGPWK